MAQPAATEIGIDTVLGETYRITGLIGRGGMGAVWAASHVRLPGKHVAVKVLLADVSGGGEPLARFRREAEIASRIGHPNIVQVLDWNTLPSGQPYLVLELLTGESLANRLKKGPVSLEAALDIARQVGSALTAAHKAGVVHRDLKPDNIFLVPTDSGGTLGEQVKVLDFGISKLRHSTTIQTQEAQILGTPQYMSPEQASGKNSLIDERTDVFALGAIVYEMLSGEPAFAGENLAAVVFKVVYEDPAPLAGLVPGLPQSVSDAVARALAKDPAKRWSDVGGFIGALTGKVLQTLERAAVGPGGVLTSSGRVVSTGGATGAGKTPSAADAFMSTMASGESPLPSNVAAAQGAKAAVPATASAQQPVVPTPAAYGQQTSGAGVPAMTFPPPAAAPVSVSTPAASTGSKKGIIAALSLVALVAAGVAVMFAMKSGGSGKQVADANTAAGPAPTAPPTPPTTQPPTQPSAGAVPPGPSVGATPVDKPADPTNTLAQAPTGDKPADKPVDKGEVKGDKPADKPDKPEDKADKPDDGGDEPTTVKEDLDAAKAALEAKNYKQAVFLANRALKTKRAPRAFAIMTQAYCGMGDLGNANATLHSVRRADRARVIRQCKSLGLDIGD
jgi:eukaryotic-like serine/threonine-protein kinase